MAKKNGVTKPERSTCLQKRARCKHCAGDTGREGRQASSKLGQIFSSCKHWWHRCMKAKHKTAMVVIFLLCWLLSSHMKDIFSSLTLRWFSSHVDRFGFICPGFDIFAWRSMEFSVLPFEANNQKPRQINVKLPAWLHTTRVKGAKCFFVCFLNL